MEYRSCPIAGTSVFVLGLISGGTAAGYLRASDSSTITIFGSGFEVDGCTVGEGPIAATSGVLTGTLESGDLIDNFFCHSGSTECIDPDPATGLITLVPEPDMALLCSAALLTLAAVRARA